MQLASTITLLGYGTSQGMEKAWDTRGRGRAARHTSPQPLNRSALAKQFYSRVTSLKISNAAESVRMVAAALGAQPTPANHPFDALIKGSKIGIEVKRFEPGRKNLKATVHSGKHGGGSKERKVAFADKVKMKKMFLVVHDMHDPKHPSIYVRRMGDRGDPRSDPNDKRTGWSYYIRTMQRVSSLEDLKRIIR
jgi:hypothetical protein